MCKEFKRISHPITQETTVANQGGLLYAHPAVICYILWLDVAIDKALDLPGYDFESPYWADQRVQELLESYCHQEAWNALKKDVNFQEHFEDESAAEHFEKLFGVLLVSIKIGKYVKHLKESGKLKDDVATMSMLREELKHKSVY